MQLQFDENEEKILNNSFYSNLDKAWSHFAHKAYQLDENEIADLSTFILEKLKKDFFESVFNKLESFLESQR